MTTPLQDLVLAQRPLGLVLDIDGTLSPIAPTPDAARLHPQAAPLLEQARDCAGVHVAILTGRAVEVGATLVNVPGLTYIGTHGLEWSDGLPTPTSVQLAPGVSAYIEPAAQLLEFAARELADAPGILIERKRVGGTIHYRLAPHPEQARARILAQLQEPARRLNLRLNEGKRMVEIQPPLRINKGEALHEFAQRFALHGVLFAGDDRTDLDALNALASLRTNGLATLGVAVKHPDTPPELLQQADMVVEGVEGMMQLLQEIVQNLQ